ncbi:LOW QUALITY PROTEIN: histamine H3 receptor-like [Pezoporus wallicus]|uniref:LOW QUALITY PROTEIN: histamine H3 receptor-like n=1 Tax=Pezoporus wallicus TaxID=35540 RepID=UPI002551A4F1|nr:LOW QUALITY PROTEIN: histamine H3 receptor-like [Pezoporus wallicus]
MGQELPWLNHSGSPRAAGSACTGDGQRGGPFAAATAALLAAFMGLLVLAPVLGNALVILAFLVDRSLRKQGNFFFLNLAIADLLVGGFCIPLYIPYVLTGEWRLGRGLGKLWLVVDYLVCTASVFNIVLISFDGSISVTRAVSYWAQKGMTRNAVLKMITVWIAAFLLYGPAILSWEHIAQKSILPERECHAEFFYNWYFLMIASTIEFFTPFITVTYLSIYLNIRKCTSLRKENLPPLQEDCEMSFPGEKREHTIFFVKSADRHKHEKRASSFSPHKKASRVSEHMHGNQSQNLNVSEDLLPLQVEVETKPHRSGFYKTTEGIYSTISRVDTADTMANRFRLSGDKRVAKSLAIIVCVFGWCWAPYTLLMIIRAACHGHCVQYSLYETSFWLLWVNSAINPVLYPLCHMSFRRAFIKLLCPGKAKIHPHIFM